MSFELEVYSDKPQDASDYEFCDMCLLLRNNSINFTFKCINCKEN
jgi:hypothetical protein